MKAYIRKNTDNNFANLNFAVALDGFQKMGWEIISFHKVDELSSLSKADIVVTYVDETKEIFSRLNVAYENIDCYPTEISSYLGRKIWKESFFSFVKANRYGYFIKPSQENKLFTGKVINRFGDLISIGQPEKDFEIYCSEPVKFVSESRCFVRYGSILDIRNTRAIGRLT